MLRLVVGDLGGIDLASVERHARRVRRRFCFPFCRFYVKKLMGGDAPNGLGRLGAGARGGE